MWFNSLYYASYENIHLFQNEYSGNRYLYNISQNRLKLATYENLKTFKGFIFEDIIEGIVTTIAEISTAFVITIK